MCFDIFLNREVDEKKKGEKKTFSQLLYHVDVRDMHDLLCVLLSSSVHAKSPAEVELTTEGQVSKP